MIKFFLFFKVVYYTGTAIILFQFGRKLPVVL